MEGCRFDSCLSGLRRLWKTSVCLFWVIQCSKCLIYYCMLVAALTVMVLFFWDYLHMRGLSNCGLQEAMEGYVGRNWRVEKELLPRKPYGKVCGLWDDHIRTYIISKRSDSKHSLIGKDDQRLLKRVRHMENKTLTEDLCIRSWGSKEEWEIKEIKEWNECGSGYWGLNIQKVRIMNKTGFTG